MCEGIYIYICKGRTKQRYTQHLQDAEFLGYHPQSDHVKLGELLDSVRNHDCILLSSKSGTIKSWGAEKESDGFCSVCRMP